MKTQPYDIIGDIHGQNGKLQALLNKLGYNPRGGTFRHAEGRRVIFLGDYIDRGPAIREVLQTVRGMVDAGDALAIMGNHEYNAVCLATPDGRGGWLRDPAKERDSGHQATLAQFAGREAEWGEWLAWMTRLPLALDLGHLRAVHACWDAAALGRIAGRRIHDPAFLHAAATPGRQEHGDVERVLKGPELDMPDGCFYRDKEGKKRARVRVRWWDMPAEAHVTHLALPTPFDEPGLADSAQLTTLPDYPSDAPPVFFGHYWLPPERKCEPLARNLACMDYSAAFGENALTAYRWDGEQVLDAAKYIQA